MSIRNKALKLADAAVRLLPVSKLPTYYYGELIWLARPAWTTLYSRYEPNTINAIKQKVRPGDTFWDVGAYVGLISLYASRLVGPAGRVVAFEPSPDNRTDLQANVKGTGNIKIMPYGVGAADCEQEFAAQGVASSGSFVREVTEINQSYHPDPISSVSVSCRRLDTVVAEERPPDFIKIDCEGYELAALQGAEKVLAGHPTLLIEIHPTQLILSGGSEKQLFELLRRHGYSWSTIDHNPNSVYTVLADTVDQSISS
jgi:FkbM family methyltransferase